VSLGGLRICAFVSGVVGWGKAAIRAAEKGCGA